LDLFIQMLEPGHVTLRERRDRVVAVGLPRFHLKSRRDRVDGEWPARARRASSKPCSERVAEFLRPELLARIRDKLVFARLAPDVQREIAELHLADEVARLKSVGFELEVSHEASEFLIREGFHPLLGARLLRQTIERHLQDAVVRGLFASGVGAGRVVFDAGLSALRLMHCQTRRSPESA
jgi:ATP-dependent Clp protease ATP-binding subunit ClpB